MRAFILCSILICLSVCCVVYRLMGIDRLKLMWVEGGGDDVVKV
jgi:hypothetical protein